MITSDNQKAARLFQEIADFLELKGENQFKVKAYQKAARALSGIERPLRDLYDSGELKSVPGIGKAIAEKIEELLQAGQISMHRQLSEEFPPQILDLMDVPGLGAKKAAVLYRELRIGSLPELEEALAAGKLRDLKGFGKKTEEKLLEGIKRLAQVEHRLPLGQAVRVAREFVAELSKLAGVETVVPAGSLRRGAETVGDLDLVCVASNSAEVMAAFCSAVDSQDVLMKGETRSSIRLSNGFQVDLRVVPADSLGAAMQYFTGSKDHNVALRARAEQRGLKLNEYGLYDQDGQVVAGRSEESIYAYLGLDFVPPELRETGAEVALAAEGRLPALLEIEQVRGNLHTHSEWSDGSDTLEELAAKARQMGYAYLAVTDHSRALVIANGLTIERLAEQGRRIDELNADFDDFRLLKGTECDILPDGTLDFPDEVLASLDLVVAAVHSSFHLDKVAMTQRILKAIENPHVDILAHPSGRILGRRPGYEVDWEEVFKAAARTQTALEINCSPKRLDLSDKMVRRARELGVVFSLGTDAHSLREFDYLPLGVGVARRGWLGPEQVLNSRDGERLSLWLKSRTA
ncbi:MAG: DNA polymerase/3'-5' exonuclease PolX [Vulcanimicrobiota bacterium]